MFYYCYIIFLTEESSKYFNHFYIGKRISKVPPELDKYHGSSSVLIKEKYFKNYPYGYSKKILGKYNNEEELNKAEKEFINLYINDSKCLNKFIGGLGGNTYKKQSESGKIKRSKNISLQKKGKKKNYFNYDEYIINLSYALRGKEKSENHRLHISESKREKKLSEEHKLNIKKGSRHIGHGKYTEAQKLNQSLKMQELYSEKPHIKKKISDSVKDTMKDPEIREKCKKGGLMTKGKLWLSNENESIRVKPEEIDKYLLLGYIRGRKKY